VNGILLVVESVPGNPRRLVLTMTEHGIDVSGRSLAWQEIDRVRYSAVDNHINGAYMGTTYTVAVGGPAKRELVFMLNSGTTGPLKSRVDHERRDRNRAEWVKAVEILEERVCVRLMTQVVTAVLGGGAVMFAGLRLDGYGVHKSGLFSRSVTWPEIAGTDVHYGYLRVLAKRAGKPKKVLEIPRASWNAVLLGRVISTLSPN
jgi:hypothetical protein